MAGRQVTHGCSEVGRVGNSRPLLSDSRYTMDRFTRVLNDRLLSDYTLAGGCAWGRCEIMAVCHVPEARVGPMRLELLLKSGDKKAAKPSFCLVCLSAGCCCLPPCALTMFRSRGGLLVTLLFRHVKSKVCWPEPGALQSSLCFGDIYVDISLLDRLVHHNPLAPCCLLSVNLSCRSDAFQGDCSQRTLTVGVPKSE